MKKTSLCLWVTVTVIAAGSAFIAHSWNQDNRGFLGRITGGATDVVAAAVDVPEKVVTGEPMSLDQNRRGALGTVVGGAGDVAAAGVDVSQNVVQGNYRKDRRYRENHEERIDTEIDAESAEYEQELFPGGMIEESDEEEIEDEE